MAHGYHSGSAAGRKEFEFRGLDQALNGRAGRKPGALRLGSLVFLGFLGVGVSCGEAEPAKNAASAAEVRGVYRVPEGLSELAGERFFDHPWPSDFRRRADGSIQLAEFPNPKQVALLAGYAQNLDGKIHGFSPVAAGYLRFDGPIDPGSLPKNEDAARAETSSVQLIDIEPSSPEFGVRRPLSLYWQKEAGVYYPEYTLAFMPAFGHPLRRDNRYALIINKNLRGENGGEVEAAHELKELLGAAGQEGGAAPPENALGRHRTELKPALAALTELGVSLNELVHLSVFTTQDPTADLVTLRDWVLENYPAPTASDWQLAPLSSAFADLYVGNYGPSPDFQRGNIPFAKLSDGGELAFKASGEPEVQREFDLRFALMVPKAQDCPMPEAGYPLVLYAHGTGGDYMSFVSREGEALAERCLASMGIDQIFHGTRPGADGGKPEVLFFNVSNPIAARANGPQSALDIVQQARLFTESGAEVPANISASGAPIRFDSSRLLFMGHSQGGLNGPMFLAVDDQTRGAVLSGSASLINITLLEKTAPLNIAALVKTVFLALSGDEQRELNELHPALTLAQTIVDPTDPIHYVPMILKEPRAGFAPKSVLMTEGVSPDGSGDSYSPPHGIEVQAVAMGLPLVEPVIFRPRELDFTPELAPFSVPAGGVSGNLAGGQASGGLVQWDPAGTGGDGHFVIYRIPEAMNQCAEFLKNLAEDPKGKVPPR